MKLNRYLIIGSLIYYLCISSFQAASQSQKDSIQWITIEEAGTKFIEVQKPILLYIYQNNCDSCRIQESTTFSNPEVANYLNILFYNVKINAETKDSIKFFDGTWIKNTGQYGKVHDFVFQMTGMTDSFPALVLFSRRAAGRAFSGYKDRDEIFRILIYYSEDVDLATSFENWHKYHTLGYPPGQSQIMTRLKVKWKTLDEALELNKTAPRKILLNFYNYNKISCTLLRTQTFNQQQIADYLNQKYYAVNVDAFTQDTLTIKGITYINENQSYKYHQLPIAALEGKMLFPAFIILDEEGNVLQKIQQYMIPEDVEPILKFFGENAYKTENFNNFKKNFKSEIINP
jgi:thioredoxin-related protein